MLMVTAEVSIGKMIGHVTPVTRGADQDEEEDVNCESVKDGYDGAFRDGNTWSLQLSFRDMWRKSKNQAVLLCSLCSNLLVYWYN